MNKIAEMRKQAYYDSHISCKKNVNKYNFSDPILQQNDHYVRNIILIFKRYNYRKQKK